MPTVREAGEYAVRGGLIDLFAAGSDAPLRFDFFGSTLESIRAFDPETQRTTGSLKAIALSPMSEVMLTAETIRRFRGRYTAAFGGNTSDDQLYAAISSGQRFPGMEHCLPFFYESLDPLTAYTGNAQFVFDDQADLALGERQEQIADYFEARESARTGDKTAGATPYKPVPAETLYEISADLSALAGGTGLVLSPFAGDADTENAGGRMPPSFAAERKAADTNQFESVVGLIKGRGRKGQRTVVAAWSEGTRERLMQLLADHGLKTTKKAENWRDAELTPPGTTAFVTLELETGFETDALLVLSEQDILGERNHPSHAAQEGRKRPDRGVESCRRAILSFTSSTVSAGSSASRPSRRPARRTIASRSNMPVAPSSICRLKTSSC